MALDEEVDSERKLEEKNGNFKQSEAELLTKAQRIVIELNSDNTQRVIDDNEFVLVLGYAPWCPRSAELMPRFAEAAMALKDLGSSVLMAKIDTDRFTKSASALEIKGVPTLLLFGNGSSQAYTGGFTSQEIVVWARKKTGVPIQRIGSVSDAKEFLNKYSIFVVGFFDKFEGSEYDEFVKAATAENEIQFIETNSINVANILFPDVKIDTVVANSEFLVSSGSLQFSGKSVGIIGLGRIGQAIGKRAECQGQKFRLQVLDTMAGRNQLACVGGKAGPGQSGSLGTPHGRVGCARLQAEAFGCPISYYSRSIKADSKYKYFPSVVELAANCQILVVACALTPETRHIVNREGIDALGPKWFVINIGRGPLVDEVELMSALVEGRLAGAGLDVFENEPNVPEELIELENVVLTPHVGSGTVETRKVMADLVTGNLEAHFSNKPLLTPVV